ncbi:ATP-binding protein [Solimonas marina]|uniref:histidine kinase n=1 Tax=Solimonas marina TaxID=2714601 RepID=A0A970B764_9GAMM|nr:ATP-binding protein [Solimonas marina]NKF20889.1 two-component sensor histidine kinase [Solimonas marina]
MTFPPSLRAKLIALLISTLVVGWLIWFGWQYHEMADQRSGEWDQSLRATAQYILKSMPSDVDSVLSTSRLRLPDDAGKPPVGRPAVHIVFQVWSLPRNEILIASPTAPRTPLAAGLSRDGASDSVIDGEPWRVYSVTDAEGRVEVQVGARVLQLREDLTDGVRRSLTAAALFLVGLSLAIWWGVSWALRPMHRLSGELARRDALNLTPLPLTGVPREVRPFVASFNQLLARLQQAVDNERQFNADVAHELRTPLAALLTQVRVARTTTPQGPMQTSLENMTHGMERLSRLVQQLLDSARVSASRDSPEYRQIDLADIAAMVPHEFGTTAARRGQVIAVSAEAGAIILGSLDDVDILLRNLIDNALRYGRDGGRVEISCSVVRDTVALRVADDGPSVPEAEREDIFRRFYRGSGTKRAHGSGIGLSLVARITQSHGATITVGPGLGGTGLGISVTFPAAVEMRL